MITNRLSILADFLSFPRALALWTWGKVVFLLSLPKLLLSLPDLLGRFKAYILRKLLWGGGRLGRPASEIALFGLALGVLFLFFLSKVTGFVFLRRYVGGGEEEFLLSLPPEVRTFTTATEPIVYEVKEGDTLEKIGKQFKVSTASIVYANNLAYDQWLREGQKLTIPPVSGVIHTVRRGETVKVLAQTYDIPAQRIIDFNYLFAPYKLQSGEEVVIPGASVPGTPRYIATSEVPTSQGIFLWPTNSRQITQYFSSYHPAIDIAKFSPIYAIEDGVVTDARIYGWNGGYGKYVKIDHGNDYVALYAHLSSLGVRVGQKVKKGQVVGLMGHTGRAYGTHLHLEIRKNGRHINPLSVL